MNSVKIYRTFSDLPLPNRAENGSVGYDIVSAEDYNLSSFERHAFSTGLFMSFDGDCYARVAPRSGLAFKGGIDVLAGVIDSSYRGEIKVILVNLSQNPFSIKRGDRIAQLIFEKAYTPLIEELDDVKNLPKSQRGVGGFGSTGF